jgi:hypothetical protein
VKVKITLELEVPDYIGEWSDGEVAQNFFEEIIQPITSHHLHAQMVLLKYTPSHNVEEFLKHHQEWIKYMENCKYTIERLTPPPV